jgi:ribosomal RNA-processing protein 7
MNKYDEKVAKDLEKEKTIEGAVDDEGWTTITGRKKRGQFALARKESTIQKVQYKEEEKKHKKQLLNFYTFQIREAKKQSKYNAQSVIKNIVLMTYVTISFRFGRSAQEI